MNTFSKIALALAAVGLSGIAQASYINELEPNDAIGTAQNVDGNITNGCGHGSTDINGACLGWVSIAGTGNDTNDYYSLTVNAGDTWSFDVDNAYDLGFDLEMFLYDLGGNLLASNDDGGSPDPDGTTGSGGLGFDPFIAYTFASAGTYVIGVCAFNCFGDPGGITGSPVPTGATYDLNIALLDRVVATPEPATLALLGLGLAGIGFLARRRRS